MKTKDLDLKLWLAITLVIAAVVAGSAFASGTKVGNGDDGADLEGGEKIESGPIYDARAKAVKLLKKLNTEGVSGLGTLIPEVETAPLYLADRDVQARVAEDQGSFHSDMRGLVFARTFAEPHSASRFFPIAEELNENQLVALHIHEGLHRALPAEIREDEAAVAAITLAITSPGANFDRIRQTASKYVPEEKTEPSRSAAAVDASGSLRENYPMPDGAAIHQPSLIGYSYTSFVESKHPISNQIQSMHSIQTYLYPFGNDRLPLGFGIEGSFLHTKQGSEMGPLGLSARMRIWSSRGFDVGAWANASLNTLSNDELKNSLFGRDLFSVGLSARRDLPFGYVEGLVGTTTKSEVKQTVGLSDYTYKFGSLISTEIRAGAQWDRIRLGGFTELLLSDSFKVESDAYNYDSGRYRILSAGPEAGWVDKNFSVMLHGRYILNATRGANYEYLGDILGRGTSQGSLSITASYFF
jgi:hypothetical protein